MHTVLRHLSTAWFAGSMLCLAQCPDDLVESVSARQEPSDHSYTIEIDLARPLDSHLAGGGTLQIPPTHFEIVVLPGRHRFPGPDVITFATASPERGYRRLRLRLRPDLTTKPAAHDRIRVRMFGLRFDCGIVERLEATGILIDTATERQKEFETRKREVEAATAYATPTDQRNFYGAFAAVKGDGGAGAGAVNLVANVALFQPEKKAGALFDHASIKLIVNKNSGANADPRNYVSGIELTKAFLWGGARRARLGRATVEEVEHLARRRSSPFRGMVFNEFVKIEGDAFDFRTVNFVSDSQFTLPSIARRIGSDGFWNFRLLAGPELGHNLTNPEKAGSAAAANTPMNYIVRTKVGADLTLRYLRTQIDPSKFALEIDAGYVNRWIHRPEPVLQDVIVNGEAVQQQVTIREGNRPWYQANVKLFLFGGAKARYGFQFGFYSGSLPPSFAKARALQVGLVFETSDDQSNGEPASQ